MNMRVCNSIYCKLPQLAAKSSTTPTSWLQMLIANIVFRNFHNIQVTESLKTRYHDPAWLPLYVFIYLLTSILKSVLPGTSVLEFPVSTCQHCVEFLYIYKCFRWILNSCSLDLKRSVCRQCSLIIINYGLYEYGMCGCELWRAAGKRVQRNTASDASSASDVRVLWSCLGLPYVVGGAPVIWM